MAEAKDRTTGRSKSAPAGPRSRLDLATVGGLVMAMGGILGGLILEKGSIRDVAQITAALIVLGGTFGATLVSTPLRVVMGAVRRLKGVVFEQAASTEGLIEELIRLATKARKNGLVSLENEAYDIPDPFLRKALLLAVDGTDLQELRKMLELAINNSEHQAEAEARVLESAGGYSPTIGIIGAVLGLIQVMKNLANIDEVGHGIAVAFVATVYGVALANVFLLPAATKIKARNQQEVVRQELILEGVTAIIEGLNPKLIRIKLEAYAETDSSKKKQANGRPEPAPAAEAATASEGS